MPVEHRRMWEGGPLRQFSPERNTTCKMYYESPGLKGYVGAYVCDGCGEPSPGIYSPHHPHRKWLCAACKRVPEPTAETLAPTIAAESEWV